MKQPGGVPSSCSLLVPSRAHPRILERKPKAKVREIWRAIGKSKARVPRGYVASHGMSGVKKRHIARGLRFFKLA